MKRILLPSLVVAVLSSAVNAQWSNDAAVNFSVADGASDQAQPKVVPTSDGGCYVSWFDGIGTGYDVRLQKLDAAGNEQWAHNGVLVADRSFSSTQDYGLDVDVLGNALLTFRDDRFTGVQVSANVVTPGGVLAWGTNGVQLTNTTGFVASPKITGLTNTNIVVSWTEDVSVKSMALTANGATVWGADVVMTPGAGRYSVSDLHGAGNDAILSLVHQVGLQIFTAKHLFAQKLDSAGALLWGATPVVIFDNNSLQIGNFPSFVLDGSGGALFTWYGTGPLQCYAQRLNSAGAELFAHNGVAVSTDVANTRVSPSAAFDAGTNSSYIFWEEQNGAQSMSGLSGQKLDASGVLQWGSTGSTLIPLGTTEINWVRTLTTPAGAYVFWLEIPSFGQDTGHGAVVDTAGNFSAGPNVFASTASGKSRLWAALSTGGDAFLGWSDSRIDSGDLLMQNFASDGSLGSSEPGTGYCYGVACPCGNNDPAAGCANTTSSGALLTCGGSASVGLDNLMPTLTGGPAGQPALLFYGHVQSNGGAGTILGDGKLCVTGGLVRLNVHFLDGAGASNWGPGLAAANGWAATDVIDLQVWYRDSTLGGCTTGSNLSNGYEVVLVP